MSIIKAVEALMRDNLPPWMVLNLIVFKKRFVGDPELKLLPLLLSENKNSVDIGGYRGLFSFHLAKLSSKVHTYEANPYLANWIKRAGMNDVHVKNVALSNSNQKMTFAIPIEGNKTQDSRASLEVAKLTENTSRVKKIEVDVERLDDQGLENIGFVKIDVEGHELEVLKGAEELIKREKPILFIEIEQRHNNNPIENTFSYVEAIGYKTFFYEDKVLKGLDRFDKNKHQQVDEDNTIIAEPYINNFFFIPESDVDRFSSLMNN